MKKILALVVSIVFCLATGIAFAADPGSKPADESAKKEEKASAKKKKTSKKKTEKKEEQKSKATRTPAGGYGSAGGYK